jgi:hypothetical protein
MEQTSFSADEVKFPLPLKDQVGGNGALVNNFLCPNCKDLVRDPLICRKCGIPCCKECIEKYNENKNDEKDYQCVDKDKCDGTYRTFTVKEREYIDIIKFKCIYEGCRKRVNYSDYKKHLDTCEFRIYHCNNKSCTESGVLEDMKIHAKNCFYKLYPCPNQNCKESFHSYEKETHLKNCEFREIGCNKCRTKIIFINKENHLKNDCPETLITCEFCGEKVKRKDYLKSHSKNASCLKKALDDLNKKYKEDMEIKNSEIENLNKLYNEELKKMKEKEEEVNILTKSKIDFQKKMENIQHIISDTDFPKNESEAPLLTVKNKIETVVDDSVYVNTDSNFYKKRSNKGSK